MKKTVSVIVIIAVILVAGYSIWRYLDYRDYLNKTVHDTRQWVEIMDLKGDILAVETTNVEVWERLVELSENRDERWIGGIVEEYENAWGFRFHPDTIIIATVTIEGAQSTIRGLSGDLDYWTHIWANVAYVLARVIEVHE